MIFPWYAALMLTVEANGVIAQRLFKLAAGGEEARHEAELMMSEKLDASFEASGTLWGGGSALSVIELYRDHVAANAKRLASH